MSDKSTINMFNKREKNFNVSIIFSDATSLPYWPWILQGGREELYFTLVPKVLLAHIFCLIKSFRYFNCILISWFQTRSVQTFPSIILINRIGNFVHHHRGCVSIYRPLSYPLRSLYFSLTLDLVISMSTLFHQI